MKQNFNKPHNPFLLSGYISPEYFCDREEETKKLVSALRNGRNITLISPRRMGKTGLIRHAFHIMEREGQEHCYLVDLYQTDSLTGLVAKLAKTVLGTLDTGSSRFLKTVGAFFKSLRPVLTVDPQTGEPGVSFDIQPNYAERSLEEILTYMENSGRQCIVAFDEFQRVAEYEDSQVEAMLRSHIQHLNNVHFIFSGSQRHVLENMFTSASRPFYQSTQLMNLGSIGAEAYCKFADSKLRKHKQQLDPQAFFHTYDSLMGHTWYIQALLNRLYENGTTVLDNSIIEKTLHEIASENEATFQTLLRLITPAQRKLLKAVAKEGEATEINSKNFLSRNHLGAASTIHAAAKSLVEKELLIETKGKFSVYDRFLAIYLSSGAE